MMNSHTIDNYTIADIATWPWVYALHLNYDDAVQVLNFCNTIQ
jgi:hypothetical protein